MKPLAVHFVLCASVLLSPGFSQASAGDPVHLSWVIHVDPSAYDTLPVWTNGRTVLDEMATVIEAHGGVMTVATSWNFLRGCLMFGNGPAFPGSIGDLAARGHEIAYHDHGGVTIQGATLVIANLTSAFTAEVYPTHLEGSGDFAELAALGYVTTGSRCGKDIPSQLSGIFNNPVRRLESSCYGEDPAGPLVGLGAGSADGSGRSTDNLDEMTTAIEHAIATHTPGRLTFVSQGASHPDDWITASVAQIQADMAALDAWLTTDIDPLIASGVLVWTDAAAKLQLFEAWEAAGGSNADLFPAANVTHPAWSFLDDTNSPLGTDRIDEVFVDAQDRVWIGGGDDGVGGLHVFDPATASWTTYDPTNSPLRSCRITSLAEGPAGVMWIVTGNDSTPGPQGTALHRFDGASWTVFDGSNAFGPESFLFDVAVDLAGIVWVGGKRALFRYDGANWTSYNQLQPAIPQHTGIFCVTPESATVVWLGLRNGGVVRLDHQGDANGANDTSTVHDRASTGGVLPGDTTYAVALHPNGDVYAGTRRGLAILSGGTWTAHDSSGSELGYDQIVDLAVDPVGDVWMATYGGGLSRYRPTLGRFAVDDIPDGTVHARLMTSVAAASDGTVYGASLITGGVSVYSPPQLATFGTPVLGETLGLTVLAPSDAGLVYAVAAAFTANAGVPLPAPDARVFPLDLDPLFLASLAGTIPLFVDFIGVLDAEGSARPSVIVPNLPSFSGLELYFAGATADAAAPSGIRTIFGPVPVTLE
ncbi:MAG: hypothetical protein CMJ83_05270 [Planctomycetes bacterium]|nr:hypothetical protein [Planctomycetota bacterium]